MYVAVIINPISGAQGHPEVARHRVKLAIELLTAEGIAHEVRVTERPGHAYELARDAVERGAALVCAWGGDGTMNEVGRAVAFSSAALGLIPAGSGNGLARELNIPVGPERAIKTALHGVERKIDVGEIGGQLFFNAAGIGFDAHIAHLFNSRAQKRRGPLPYLTIAARELFSYRPSEYTITVDGETMQLRALLIALANSRQYGNGATVAPQARFDDGKLDLVVVKARSPLATLREARRLFTGTLTKANGVVMRRAAQVTITGASPLLFHVDGEPMSRADTPLTARLYPGVLKVKSGTPRV